MVLTPGEQDGVESRFLGHIELGQCRKCNSLKRTQVLAEVCRIWLLFSFCTEIMRQWLTDVCWQIVISKFVCNMAGTAVHLLGVERGNATMLSRPYNVSSVPTDPVSSLKKICLTFMCSPTKWLEALCCRSVCVSVCAFIPKHCYHNILSICWQNLAKLFTKWQTLGQGWMHQILGSRVKVTVGSSMP